MATNQGLSTFTFCLNVTVDAADREQAIEMAEYMAKLLKDPVNAYKIVGEVEIDDVEEL